MVWTDPKEVGSDFGICRGESQATASTIHVKATVFHFLVPALVPLKKHYLLKPVKSPTA